MQTCSLDVGRRRAVQLTERSHREADAGLLVGRFAVLESVETRLRTAELERVAEAARAAEALHTVAETEARA